MKFLDPVDHVTPLDFSQAFERAQERYGKPFRSLTNAPRLEPLSRNLQELNALSKPQESDVEAQKKVAQIKGRK